jgi:hypothetical protein
MVNNIRFVCQKIGHQLSIEPNETNLFDYWYHAYIDIQHVLTHDIQGWFTGIVMKRISIR